MPKGLKLHHSQKQVLNKRCSLQAFPLSVSLFLSFPLDSISPYSLLFFPHLAHLRMHEAKLATFSNVLQCQRDALTKGVEIIQRTLDKFEEEEENGVDHVSDHVGDGQKVLAVGKEEK